MDRKLETDPFPPLPTPAEMRRYEKSGRGGPTLQPFRLNVSGRNACCKWNKRGALIAAHAYTNQEPGQRLTGDVDLVQKLILTHIRALGIQYQNLLLMELDPDDDAHIQQERRRAHQEKVNRRRDVSCIHSFSQALLSRYNSKFS